MKSFVFGLLFLLDAAQGDWVQQEPDVQPWHPDHSMWLLEAEGVPKDYLVQFTVALKVEEDRRAVLEKTFWEVSDPKHEKYGQHLTLTEITDLLNVSQQSQHAVWDYFWNGGKGNYLCESKSFEPSFNKDMATVGMTAACAEQLLKTKLGWFTHREYADRRIVRASTTYYLPEEIDAHVELVGELLQFPRLRLKELDDLQTGAGSWPNECNASVDPEVSHCNGFVTPEVLAKQYKFPNDKSNKNDDSGNRMAVAEFEAQYFDQDPDLTKFGQVCHRDVKVDDVVYDAHESYPKSGTEAYSDIEIIKAVAPQVPLTVFYAKDYSLLNWANRLHSSNRHALVHSVSYGNDKIQQSGRQYMRTINIAFMKAGARGVSILIASGDQGACGRSGCGKGNGKHAVRFQPDFPADSPYVTAVGGTDFAGSRHEMAWSDGGGGFSDNFDIPDFQKAAVAAYKASADADLPPRKLWNPTGRGYPDIAAHGGQKAPYCITSNGRFTGVAGTSAASPVAAGIFALLNGLRLSQNKAPLGFLNPFIYQNPSAFQDVTSGINDGGARLGFKAVKGWDAATGLGTPDYEALSKVVVENIGPATII